MAGALLALCLTLTLAGWKSADNSSHDLARERFEVGVTELSNFICDRVTSYELALRGGLALFSSVQDVSRTQWRDYVGKLNLQDSYPGIQGVGYSQIVPAASRQQHIETIRQQGFPDYSIRPSGERSVYTSIIYLEPFDARNKRAFGYDMFSEPTRRVAMERARDTGNSTISGRVTLVQETAERVQAGFLMYLPFYKPGAPVSTVEDRCAALQGYVYSPFRMDDFMEGLGKSISGLRLEVFDDTAMTEKALMFRNGSEVLASAHLAGQEPFFTAVRQVRIFGHTWTLRAQSLPAYEAKIDNSKSPMILGGGICISLLVFSVALSLVSTKARAVAMANSMTASLRESQESFQLLLESTGEAIYGIDLNGNCTFSNPACLRMLGYSRAEEFLGKNMHWLAHHSHADGSHFEVENCRIFQAFQNGVGTHVDDEVFWRADGSSFPAEYWSYPQRRDGEIVGAVVTFVEITERKQYQDVLNALLVRLQLATQASNIGIWEYDPVHNDLIWDDMMYSIYGVEKDRYTINYNSWDDMLHADDVEQVRSAIQRALSGEGDFSLDFKVVWPSDQSIHYIKTNAIVERDKDDNPLRMVGANWDITARKNVERELQAAYSEIEQRVAVRTQELARANELLQAEIVERKLVEEALTQNEARLKLVLNGIEAGIVCIDPQTFIIQDMNAVAEEILGLEPGEAKGEDCHEFYWKRIEGEPPHLFAVEGVAHYSAKESLYKRMDGNLTPISRAIFSAPVYGHLQLFEIIFDISEKKALERQLVLSQKLESVGILAAGIAHEINTPIQYVGGSMVFLKDAFSDLGRLLARAGELSREEVPCEPGMAASLSSLLEEIDAAFLQEEVPRTIERVFKGIERISTIVQAMKRFSYPSGDDKKAVNLHTAIENTLVISRSEWKYVAETHTSFDPELPHVLCLPGDINQVFLNIIINAAHAIGNVLRPGGGLGLISISTKKDGEYAEIRIADTGTGIPKENESKVFNPFFTTKEVGKGTGQGLAISYDIVVNKHGGTITFESEPGQGTTFIIRLPLDGGARQGKGHDQA